MVIHNLSRLGSRVLSAGSFSRTVAGNRAYNLDTSFFSEAMPLFIFVFVAGCHVRWRGVRFSGRWIQWVQKGIIFYLVLYRWTVYFVFVLSRWRAWLFIHACWDTQWLQTFLFQIPSEMWDKMEEMIRKTKGS